MEELKKRNRLEKSKKYVKEREELIGKFDGIIGLDENNNRIIIADIDSIELRNKIRDLVPEVRKYHRCSTWHYFKVEEEEKDEIGLMKSVYKNSGYEITNKRRILERKGEKKQMIELHFNKKLATPLINHK